MDIPAVGNPHLIAVPVSSIKIPEYRQRSSPLDREKILELGESFKKGRQIHPIVLRREGESWILVAGFRRLITRMKLVPNMVLHCGGLLLDAGMIAATDWGNLGELEREEIELEENTARLDLTTPEKAAAIGKLDALRQAQARARGTVYTTLDLATEARVAPNNQNVREKVNEAATLLQLSKHLDNPEAAKVKTIADARRFLQKVERESRNAALRAAYEKTSDTGISNRAILGSCYDPAIQEQLPSGHFDVACFDPPYGIKADAFGEQGGDLHGYADSPEEFDKVCANVPRLLERILKPEAHLYAFCDPRGYTKLAHSLEFAGFEVWHVPLIWVKNRGIAPRPEHGPRRTYEMILFASRGGRKTEMLLNDTLIYPAVQTPRHGAEKPVGLIADLLMRSVRPGQTIIDLFAGSGTIFPAANACSCIAWGIEQVEVHYNLAVSRLQERPSTGGEPGEVGTPRSPLEDLK